MEQKQNDCVRIEFEYADGTVYRALGADAEQIRKWIDGATVMNFIHGFKYDGPTPKLVEEKNG